MLEVRYRKGIENPVSFFKIRDPVQTCDHKSRQKKKLFNYIEYLCIAEAHGKMNKSRKSE